ncbi:hypothetical protein IGI37_002704 [Enterococcus sp. AZ194]|uniref:hypothetical protein n=1 Tax=Enterococcus sp. AZ194 TaxID=2774629 RepID=UPI003F29B226
MKKMGIYLFDSSIEIIRILLIYLFLNAVWLSYGFVIISPFLVVATSLLGLQTFLWINFFFACSLVALLVFLTPWLLQLTKKILLQMGEVIHGLFKNYSRCCCES